MQIAPRKLAAHPTCELFRSRAQASALRLLVSYTASPYGSTLPRRPLP